MQRLFFDINVILDILTRNPSDFKKSKLPIYTPEEFLEQLEHTC